jgi:hypothetical protein
MKNPTDSEIIEDMKEYGGSFAAALARAAQVADESNLAIIKTAFAPLWEHYAAMNIRQKEQG